MGKKSSLPVCLKFVWGWKTQSRPRTQNNPELSGNQDNGKSHLCCLAKCSPEETDSDLFPLLQSRIEVNIKSSFKVDGIVGTSEFDFSALRAAAGQRNLPPFVTSSKPEMSSFSAELSLFVTCSKKKRRFFQTRNDKILGSFHLSS